MKVVSSPGTRTRSQADVKFFVLRWRQRGGEWGGMLCLLPLTAALHAPVRAPGTLRASAPFVSVSAALHVPVRATPIVLRAAAPSLSISTPRAVGEPIRVGIVGCGRIGIVHLETLRKCPKAKVVSIGGSSREETVSALAEKYGIAHFAKDADEVIRNPDVDAVWICSPSQYHAAQIRLAAELGKDIFCEKPIATELDETIQSVLFAREKGAAAHRRHARHARHAPSPRTAPTQPPSQPPSLPTRARGVAGVKLMVALQRRFDPNFMRVKSAIMDGEIGSPVQIRLTSRDPSPPPKKYVEGGGGIFKDMAIHDLDMSRFLMGEDPLEVCTRTHTHTHTSPAPGRALPCRAAALVSGRAAAGRSWPLPRPHPACLASGLCDRLVHDQPGAPPPSPPALSSSLLLQPSPLARLHLGPRLRLAGDRRSARPGGVRHGHHHRQVPRGADGHHRRLPPGEPP